MFFWQFFNKFEFDAISNIMLVFITSMTLHFKKIYEIFIFKFTDFFVRNFVFLTSFFTIFASFFFIFRFVSIDRTLHIVIFIDVIDIWLSIKKLTFFNFVRIKISNFFFHQKKFLCAQIFESIFSTFYEKECRNNFVTSFYERANTTHTKNWNILDIFLKNSDNCVFNFSICAINSSINWLSFCLTCFNF